MVHWVYIGAKNWSEVPDLPRKLATCSYHPNSLVSITQIIPALKPCYPIMILDPSDVERFIRQRRSKNPNISLGRTTRASMRQLTRGTLHIVEPKIQEENSGSDTSSDDGEESDENYQISPRGTKRSGRQMRGSSSSSGCNIP